MWGGRVIAVISGLSISNLRDQSTCSSLHSHALACACARALALQVVLSKPTDTGYASSGSAPLSDYMVELSSSSSFDAASTAAVRISSQNSAATVTKTLTGADVAFLAANTEYYVRGNASNSVRSRILQKFTPCVFIKSCVTVIADVVCGSSGGLVCVQ